MNSTLTNLEKILSHLFNSIFFSPHIAAQVNLLQAGALGHFLVSCPRPAEWVSFAQLFWL